MLPAELATLMQVLFLDRNTYERNQNYQQDSAAKSKKHQPNL
jgi:hypothetical protein